MVEPPATSWQNKSRTVKRGSLLKYNVVDAIRVVTGRAKPGQVWKDIKTRDPSLEKLAERGKNNVLAATAADVAVIIEAVKAAGYKVISDAVTTTTGGSSSGSGSGGSSGSDGSGSDGSGSADDAVPTARATELLPDNKLDFLQLDYAALGRIRKTSEDPPRVSIYDVIGAVTGASNPRCTWQELASAHLEVVGRGDNFKFPGQGQRETPVTDAKGIVQILMLLPGKAAASFRMEAAKVMVRFLGGDLSLVDDVAAMHAAQQQLPDSHPARFFGQTVESDRRASSSTAGVPDPPAIFPHPGGAACHAPGAQHLYALQCLEPHDDIWKIGVSKNELDRVRSINSKEKSVQAVHRASWTCCGVVEQLLLKWLPQVPDVRQKELALNSTEYRLLGRDMTVDKLNEQVMKAWDLWLQTEGRRTKTHYHQDDNDDYQQHPDLKKRKLALDLDEREMTIKANAMKAEADAKERSLKAEADAKERSLKAASAELELEKQRLELDKARWAFELEKRRQTTF